jgi:prophage muMc02, nuclease
LQAQRPAPGEMALLPQSLPVYDATDAVDTGLQSSHDKTAAIRCKEEIPLQ